ncbi:MAG: hypothetical protein JWR07_1816 [Nevskia sp.]|nr:hypothetical protein [Nevskia sp.]
MNSDTIEWILEHSVSAYEAERDATSRIKERISFVITLAITPFSGIVVYLASGFKGHLAIASDLRYFWIPLAVAILILLLSATVVAYVLLRGFEYMRVPQPLPLIDYLEQHPEPDKALDEARLNLVKEYAKSVDHNVKQNERRTYHLLLAQRLAFFSLLPIILALPRYALVTSKAKSEAQPVELVSPIHVVQDISMSNQITQESSPDQGRQATDTTPAQPIPAPAAAGAPVQSNQSAQDSSQTPLQRPAFPKSIMTRDSMEIPAPGKKIPKKDDKAEK